MHVLILHNSHSTTDWGSAQHSVSEGRKLKHNKHMASDLGNLQPRSRGFSAFLKKRTTALCWHNPPAELCSPVLQGLWVSTCSVLAPWDELAAWAKGRGQDVPENRNFRSQGWPGSSGTAAPWGHHCSHSLRCHLRLIKRSTCCSFVSTFSRVRNASGLSASCIRGDNSLYLNRTDKKGDLSNFIFNGALAGFRCYWFKRQ